MEEQSLVKKAREFAEKIHLNHLRKSGDSYSEHTSRVTQLLQGIGVIDDVTLASSYLHHALDITHQYDLLKEFNNEIYEIVKDYKDLSEDKFSNIQLSNIDENIIVEAYLNLTKNPKTLLIRMADKTDNIKSAHRLPKDWQIKVAERALYIYSPLCKVTGLNSFSNILEDGAFKILNPAEYYRTERYIKKNFPRINHELEEIKNVLTDLFNENNINTDIKSRIKGIYSSYSKLKRYVEKGQISKEEGYKKLFDFAGIRILVDNEEDCYKCEDILMRLWDQLPGTRDDYISKPKPNGYRTLQCSYISHNNLVIEAQIRTHKMHEENEFGFASHFMYKTDGKFRKSFHENPGILRNLSYALNRENFDIKQFSKSIYIYTPKGDIKKLPKGSNIIDFAYAVHDELGNTAIGGEVNGEFKPLEYMLQNGDVVHIKTDKNKKNIDRRLLESVKTRKAREHIRKLLRKHDRENN